jgi:sulfatase modifying factor 1
MNRATRPSTLELRTGTLVLVPRGVFTMGTDDPDADGRERPAHPVFVDDFYIDREMVTNAHFERFCRETGYRTTAERSGKGDTYCDGAWAWVAGACWRHPRGPGSDAVADHPAVLVTLEDALAYAAWRSRVEGRWFRPPTEAEWEKAARGTDGRRYPWGDAPVDEGGVLRARYCEGPARGTAPSGAHPAGASPFGVLDMAGNAWDWCLDVFEETYYRRAPAVDTAGPLALSDSGAFRGGSWIFPREALHSSGRHTTSIIRPSAGIGFRTVLPLGRGHRLRVVLRQLACRQAHLVAGLQRLRGYLPGR